MEKSVICLPSPRESFQAEKSIQEKKQGKGESVGLRVLIGIHRNMLTVGSFLPVESSKEISADDLNKTQDSVAAAHGASANAAAHFLFRKRKSMAKTAQTSYKCIIK